VLRSPIIARPRLLTRPAGLCLAVAVLLLTLAWLTPARAEPVDEAKIGAEAAAQLEKEVKLVDNPAEIARLSAIANRLAVVSERPDVKYTVKILDVREINAFSIPGGHLYITKGTLDVVESDDEVAAVLAHEVAHNAKRHSLEAIQKEARAERQLALVLLATVLSGQRVDAGNVMLVGSLLKAAVVNSYSRKAELQADNLAIDYLRATGYNPVAMLTVVEGLAKIEYSRPRRDPGVLQSHPFGNDRTRAVTDRLRELKIDLNRRPVLRTLLPSVEAAKEGEAQVGVLKLDGTPLLSVAANCCASGPERAQAMADSLRRVLLRNAQVYEFDLRPSPEGYEVTARYQPVIAITQADAALAATSPQGLAQKVLDSIKLAFWREAVSRGY